MKKIDPILIPELNRLAENQRVKTNITPAGDLVMSDFSYKKGHDSWFPVGKGVCAEEEFGFWYWLFISYM